MRFYTDKQMMLREYAALSRRYQYERVENAIEIIGDECRLIKPPIYIECPYRWKAMVKHVLRHGRPNE